MIHYAVFSVRAEIPARAGESAAAAVFPGCTLKYSTPDDLLNIFPTEARARMALSLLPPCVTRADNFGPVWRVVEYVACPVEVDDASGMITDLAGDYITGSWTCPADAEIEKED